MHKTILITGGCRSGKSKHALTVSDNFTGNNKIFVATCVPSDEEMRKRVLRHQRERGTSWTTIEEPLDLVQVITGSGPGCDLMLIDCLTLWLSNLLAENDRDSLVESAIDRLGKAIEQPPCPIVLVTNEVGAGIVPENPLARRFRDYMGWTNQRLASVCHEVAWCVAGLPVPIKTLADNPFNRAT